MKDALILKILADDISTGGHTIGNDVKSLSNEDLLVIDALIHHWQFQVRSEVDRRSLMPRF